MGRPTSATTTSAANPGATTMPEAAVAGVERGATVESSAIASAAHPAANLDSGKRRMLALRRTGRPETRLLTPRQGVGLMINRLSLALMATLAVALAAP